MKLNGESIEEEFASAHCMSSSKDRLASLPP